MKLQLASEERTLLLKQQLREKELASQERILKYRLEIARLRAQNPAASSAGTLVDFGPDDHLMDTSPPSNNFDSLTFGVDEAPAP